MRTNTLRLLAFAGIASLAACATDPLQAQLQTISANCNAGNQYACDEVPQLQQQVEDERARQQAIGMMWLATHPVYTPTYAYQAPAQIHCSSIATGILVSTNCY